MKYIDRQDSRINARYPVWIEYIVMLVVMLCLTSNRAVLFFSYVDMSTDDIPNAFIIANIGYWCLMTLVFCVVATIMRKCYYDRPLKVLCEAARQVARGDFSVKIGPMRKDGKKDYVEVMFEDFNKMVEELASIEMLTVDFVSGVSHEIKSPLAVIQSYTMALQKNNITHEQRMEYTKTIILATEKLNALVTSILKLSKLENQKIVPTWKEYNLCSQLIECALTFEDLWESKNISFTANIEERVSIRADRDMMEIVWNNLLSNALKFTDSGGNVMLTQTSDKETVTVIVSDTGYGMSETTMNRIFDKFYQGDSSHSQQGNGLGLALAKRVIELAGGSISVSSELGKGSTFTVRLKAVQ